LIQSLRERDVCIDEGKSDVPSFFAAAMDGGEGGICAGTGVDAKITWIRQIKRNTIINVFEDISFMFSPAKYSIP
jgi:hypothetical protein